MIKLLIVEDHEDFRQALKKYLQEQKLSLEIYEASTGEMAVTKAACVKPHIVLMDINLPHADGLKTSIVIREDNPHCDVIILTMFEIEHFRKIAKDIINAAAFIGKSEVYDKLVPVLRKCIERQQELTSKKLIKKR